MELAFKVTNPHCDLCLNPNGEIIPGPGIISPFGLRQRSQWGFVTLAGDYIVVIINVHGNGEDLQK